MAYSVFAPVYEFFWRQAMEARVSVESHLGLRMSNFVPKKPSNGVCFTFLAVWFDLRLRR